MPQPSLRRETADEAVARVEAALREGFRPSGFNGTGIGAVAKAAEAWGISRSTLQGRLASAKALYGLEPDESAYRPRVYQHASPGLPAMVSQDHITEPMPEGDPVTVCVIGDAHDSPHLPNKERFKWLGAFAAEHECERVVSIGDWMTMDCFSSHTDRATFEGFSKPTFEQDLESFHASQRAFQAGLAGWKPKLDITLGNHEKRAWTYDNRHPDGLSHGLLLQQAFAPWGWRTTPYGEYRFIGGVGFIHIPLNGLSKPLAQGQRVNKAMFDTVHGDDHRALQLTDYKSGPFRSPTVYGAATALPNGFIEGFANKGASAWRSGVCKAVIWGGHVRSWTFTEMSLLEHRYGSRRLAA